MCFGKIRWGRAFIFPLYWEKYTPYFEPYLAYSAKRMIIWNLFCFEGLVPTTDQKTLTKCIVLYIYKAIQVSSSEISFKISYNQKFKNTKISNELKKKRKKEKKKKKKKKKKKESEQDIKHKDFLLSRTKYLMGSDLQLQECQAPGLSPVARFLHQLHRKYVPYSEYVFKSFMQSNQYEYSEGLVWW